VVLGWGVEVARTAQHAGGGALLAAFAQSALGLLCF
jgi:hypothetical protein